MPSQSKVRQGGFTIVELMIVLAVGSLILTMIFLAVPTLQRAGRNNERKQDITALLGAISQYKLNHSGTFPSSTPAEKAIILKNAKRTYYTDPASITISATPASNTTTPDIVTLYNYSKCNSNGDGDRVSGGAGYSDVVALFSIETTTSSAFRCQEL